jgi:hypothetical protein
MNTAARFGRWMGWVCLSTLCATLYGIINDQVTVTLSPEYFSVFKREQFWSPLVQAGLLDAPARVQAVLVGALATWWFGLLVGIVLGTSGMVGRQRPLSTRDYLGAVAGVMLLASAMSLLFGAAAFLIEPAISPTPEDWPFLTGIRDVRRAFAVGWWHSGAYLGGVVGTIFAILWIRKRRGR